MSEQKDYDWMPEARAFAAQCWCDEETSSKEMDAALCEAVARRIANWMQTGAFHANNESFWRDEASKQRAKNAELLAIKECAQRLVDHADTKLGGCLNDESPSRDIPSNAISMVKARHLASLRAVLAKHKEQEHD